MFNSRKLLISSAIAAVTLIAGAGQASELVVNGGFESPSILGAGYYNIGIDHAVPGGFGWSLDSGDVDLVTYFTAYAHTAPAGGGGAQLLDMVGFNNGVISQALATIVGQTYTFSFDYSHNPGVGGGTMGFSLESNNGQLLGGAVSDNDFNQTWQHYSATFTADTTNTLLTFNSYDTCCFGGIFLDNVSVTSGAVPEPATWALMITGFGLVGSTLRRRRAIAA